MLLVLPTWKDVFKLFVCVYTEYLAISQERTFTVITTIENWTNIESTYS